jgi:hypothetical protein
MVGVLAVDNELRVISATSRCRCGWCPMAVTNAATSELVRDPDLPIR